MPTGIYKHGPRSKEANIKTGIKNKISLLGNKNAKSKFVYRINHLGGFIYYETIKEACKDTEVLPSSISNVLHGRAITAGGYRWSFEKP